MNKLISIFEKEDNVKKIKSLNLQNVNVSVKISKDKTSTPLVEAVKYNRVNSVNYLINELSADVNYHTKDTYVTPLMIAVKKNNFTLVKLLLQKGASVINLNKWNDTPLSLASDKMRPVLESSCGMNKGCHLLIPSGFENPIREILIGATYSKLKIRTIHPNDQNIVSKLYKNAYQDYYIDKEAIETHEKWFDQVFKSDMKDIFQWYGSGIRPQTAFWIAELDDNIVGCIAITPVHSSRRKDLAYTIGELQRFAVDKKYRRYGIGKLLVYHLETWAQSQGYESIFLRTLPNMTNAINFYTNYGYQRINTPSTNTVNFRHILESNSLSSANSSNSTNLGNYESSLKSTHFGLETIDNQELIEIQNKKLSFFVEKTLGKGKVYLQSQDITNKSSNIITDLIITNQIPFPIKRDFTNVCEVKDAFIDLVNEDGSKYLINQKFEILPSVYVEENEFALCNIGSETYELTTNELTNLSKVIQFNYNFKNKGPLLTDYFNEAVRMEAIYEGEGESPLQLFRKPEIAKQIVDKALSKYREISDYSLRNSMYGIISGANLFKPQLAKSIYNIFNANRVLDMCSGWGDRLLGAMATKSVERYLGFDPNKRLIPGYQRMMNMFSGINGGDYEVHFIPFENSKDIIGNEKFDLAFTSPPFFDLEIYTNDEGQSIDKNQTLDDWKNNWLFPMMKQAWNTLTNGGHLALYINDSLNNDLVVCQSMLDYASTLPNNQWVGIIGVESEGKSKKYRTLYVWRKGIQIPNIPLYK